MNAYQKLRKQVPDRYKGKFRIATKRSFWLTRWLSALGWLKPNVWITIGPVIYCPDMDPFPENERAMMGWMRRHKEILAHEMVHVQQFARLRLLGFLFLYLLFPLPVFFSGRWWLERGAYLVNVKRHGMGTRRAVQTIHQYGWPWPRSLMQRWFDRQ